MKWKDINVWVRVITGILENLALTFVILQTMSFLLMLYQTHYQHSINIFGNLCIAMLWLMITFILIRWAMFRKTLIARMYSWYCSIQENENELYMATK